VSVYAANWVVIGILAVVVLALWAEYSAGKKRRR
jgi:hypothetical protein